jgi:hypothetical protein
MLARSFTYIGAALRHRWSFAILVTGAIVSMARGSATPLLFAAGADLIFVGMAASSSRFRRAVDARRSRKQAKQRARRNEALLSELAPNQREHFLGLQVLAGRIEENFARVEAGEALAARSRHRIDALLQAFLRLLVTLDDHRRYLSGTNRETLERELQSLAAPEGTEGAALREIKQRRAGILRKRLERFENAKESREVIAHQLASIEDLLRLLHEQSITLRDPAGISLQLDALSIEVEEAENTVRELDRLLAFDLELRALGGREAG